MPKGVYQRSPETIKMITQRVKEARKKRLYHPRTALEKEAISIGTKKALEGKHAWNLGQTKETNESVAKYAKAREGRKLTQEQKNKISETLKANPLKPMLGKHHSEESRQKIREARARQKSLPKENTLPERIAKQVMSKNNIDYIHQFSLYPMLPKRSKSDFFLPFHSIFLFIDGDFIHANPKFHKANDLIWPDAHITAKDIWLRDKFITKTLRKAGFSVVRVWEDDILKNPEQAILSALEMQCNYKIRGNMSQLIISNLKGSSAPRKIASGSSLS